MSDNDLIDALCNRCVQAGRLWGRGDNTAMIDHEEARRLRDELKARVAGLRVIEQVVASEH